MCCTVLSISDTNSCDAVANVPRCRYHGTTRKLFSPRRGRIDILWGHCPSSCETSCDIASLLLMPRKHIIASASSATYGVFNPTDSAVGSMIWAANIITRLILCKRAFLLLGCNIFQEGRRHKINVWSLQPLDLYNYVAQAYVRHQDNFT